MHDDQGDGLDGTSGEIETPFLTPETAAAILQISPHTLKRARCRGEGPPFRKHGDTVRYLPNDDRSLGPPVDLDDFVRRLIQKNGSPYLTTRQAAAFLRMGASTLEKKRNKGTGPRYREHGHRIVYHILDLIAWSKSQCRIMTRDTVDIHHEADDGDDDGHDNEA